MIARSFPLAYRKALCGSILTASLALLAVPSAGFAQAPAKQLRIAAAADLQTVLPTLAATYEHATGVHLVIAYGSSATLTQQIENGAPQDIFLSADTSYPARLITENLSDDAAPVPYARGELVLWARKDSPVQQLTLTSLNDPKLQKLAVANAAHAPYGRAAVAAIASLHLTEQLQPKLVIAENISQTAQFADSGNAQAALISLTIASSPHFRDAGTFVRVPSTAYPEIRQSAIVLKSSPSKPLAHDFLHWLTSTQTQLSLLPLGLKPAKD